MKTQNVSKAILAIKPVSWWRRWWKKQNPVKQDRFATLAPIAAVLLFFTAIAFLACNNTSIKQSEHQTATRKPTATAPEILAKKQVPILCYHQIRAWRADDSESTKDYVVAPETFKEHIKMLADSGYTSILPDQLYEYLSLGKTLPKNRS